MGRRNAYTGGNRTCLVEILPNISRSKITQQPVNYVFRKRQTD